MELKNNMILKVLLITLLKHLKFFKDKKITLLNESETLFENEFIKITGKAYLGAKMISDKKPIETIEYEDKKIKIINFLKKLWKFIKN